MMYEVITISFRKIQPFFWALLFGISSFIQHQMSPLSEEEIFLLKKSQEAKVSAAKMNSKWRGLDENDLRVFFKRRLGVLPQFKNHFQKAALEFQIPWQLIAAVAYQESQWKPEARSYTGVRGIMQLTEETAQAMGVDDRVNPQQSIYGGAKYLHFLFEMMPTTISAGDRLALVLAAYNIGYGHLQDGQELARKIGKNPWVWKELKTVLPLLNQKKYYSQTQFGQARGHETVQFVERTRSFYEILVVHN